MFETETALGGGGLDYVSPNRQNLFKQRITKRKLVSQIKLFSFTFTVNIYFIM